MASPPKLILDARDSLVLKGAGILAIALHNYFHFLSRAEHNEYDFSRSRVIAAMMRSPRANACSASRRSRGQAYDPGRARRLLAPVE